MSASPVSRSSGMVESAAPWCIVSAPFSQIKSISCQWGENIRRRLGYCRPLAGAKRIPRSSSFPISRRASGVRAWAPFCRSVPSRSLATSLITITPPFPAAVRPGPV